MCNVLSDWIPWSSSCTGYYNTFPGYSIWSKKLIIKVCHFSTHFNTCQLFLSQRCTWNLNPGGARRLDQCHPVREHSKDFFILTFQAFSILVLGCVSPNVKCCHQCCSLMNWKIRGRLSFLHLLFLFYIIISAYLCQLSWILFRSLWDTGQISWLPIQVTKSPGCEGKCFKVHSTLFLADFFEVELAKSTFNKVFFSLVEKMNLANFSRSSYFFFRLAILCMLSVQFKTVTVQILRNWSVGMRRQESKIFACRSEARA